MKWTNITGLKKTIVRPRASNEVKSEPKKNKRLSSTVNLPQPDRIRMQMDVLRNAVESARDIYCPSWIDLYNIYRNTTTDAHVRSQYQTAVNKLIASNFVMARGGQDNEELTGLFKRPWFDKFLEFCYVSELWGYTALEFGLQDQNGEFTDLKIFPRFNIYPFNRNIIINQENTAGFYYGDEPARWFLLELSEPDNLGLLELISREVIWKAFARRDWSEHSEKYGKPHVIVYTDTEDTAETDKREQAAANFANNGYMIADKELDKVEFLESTGTGTAYLIYEKNIRLIDEQISKLMNGQTSSSDEKAWVGSAEVHERILDDWHHSRLRRYTNIINYKLIPFLAYHGYPLQEGDTGRFTELDPKVITQENPEEPQLEETEENTPEPGKPVKKKVNLLPW
ncbi:MAG: DUF935 family protein [Desulfotomaculaceae bacterium]